MRRPRVGVAKRLVNPKLTFQIKERTMAKISRQKKCLHFGLAKKQNIDPAFLTTMPLLTFVIFKT